ncbi:MAG: AI-2E family transporter [Methylophilus sp.]|nr:AI-2E family transporter [Methylophilus sp.]
MYQVLSKKVTHHEIAAWVLMGLALVFILLFHLLPALIAGLLVYELVFIIAPHIERRIPGDRSKLMAVGLLVVIVVSLLTFSGAGLIAFFRSDAGSLTVLLSKMALILEDTRKVVPPWLLEHLPPDAITFKAKAAEWLREHASLLQIVGKEAGRVFVHIILGMIVGGIVALHDALEEEHYKPFAQALVGRVSLLAQSFRRVVFAQVRIAAINAAFTGIYLAVVLPLMGIHLPLVKTMIALTFVLGLIPVAGNLISNTIIVIVSLSQSLSVAIASLVYLVVIHKLEYFLNARIVGGEIRAHVWELLITMLMMEAIFGIAGIVAAPIYYAYIKSELTSRHLV